MVSGPPVGREFGARRARWDSRLAAQLSLPKGTGPRHGTPVMHMGPWELVQLL